MSKKSKEPSKSEFVRSQPSELSASEVVAKAKEAGMSMTTALVYKVRSVKKSKGPGPAKKSKSRKSRSKKTGGKLSASAYIRAQPAAMTAKEVAAKGSTEGYSFKPGLVYEVRSAQKRRQSKAGKSAPAMSKATAAASHKPTTAAKHSSHRAQFRKLMIRIGLDLAEALYADVHQELKAIEERD
jgi:hypothetical protein